MFSPRKYKYIIASVFLFALLLAGTGFGSGHSEAAASSVQEQGTAGATGPSVSPPPGCAPNWTIVPNANPHIHNHLLAIEPVAANDVWAVGYYYESTVGQAPDTALIMHYDGTQWSEYALPTPIVGRLNGISRVSASDIWAVGWTNESGTDTATLILHYDGTAWSRVSSPTVEGISELNDVTAIASSDAWAVGSVNGTHGTLVEHWNGSYWAIVPSPPQSFGDNYILTAVAALSANDIWAVGLIDQGSGFQRTLTEHWNGSSWNIVSSPNPGSYYSRLDGVTAIAPNDVWAVGSFSSASGSDPDMTLVEHWNGTAWSVVSSPSPGLFFNALRDVTAASANDVWAVGYASDDLQLPDYTVIEHWDGATWSVVSSPNSPTQPDSNLWGVTARDGIVWAVGKGEHKYDNNQPWDTLVLRQSCPAPPTVTGTPPTATVTAISTATATPTACSASNANYTITTSSGATVVPATTDIGLHCDSCKSTVALPFAFALYGQSFTSVIAGSNGTLGFVANSNSANTTCLPSQEFNYAILPYWQELHLSNTGGGCLGCGIFTSVEGTAPGRTFNIEWRARDYFYTALVNVEVRLHEGTSNFEVIYGSVPSGTDQQVTVGVQKEMGLLYTQYVCETATGTIQNGTKFTFTQPSCGPGTATSTATVAGTATASTGIPHNTATRTALSGTVTATNTRAAGTATTMPIVTATACTITFSDIPPGNAFYTFIRCLACSGIISGYDDGTFRPGNDITRGQIAKIVSNAAGFTGDPGPQDYEDVPLGSPFFAWVNRLSNREHMGGYECGLAPEEPCVAPNNYPYFRPNAPASRGQLSKIVSNAAGLSDVPTDQFYTDVPQGHPFYLWIMRLTNLGVMSGYPCDSLNEPCDTENHPYFRPFNNVTRGQASKIVANSFFPGCTP
jgi:hypothetical protein